MLENFSDSDRGVIARRAHRLDHDLRTPIGTIATALELLRAGNAGFDDADIEALHVIERQVARLTKLADELRELATDIDPGL